MPLTSKSTLSAQRPTAFSHEDMYAEISNDILSYETDATGQVSVSAGRNDGAGFSLLRLENFVRAINSTTSMGFNISHTKTGQIKVEKLKLAKIYFDLIKLPHNRRRYFSSETICSPHVLLFFECFEKVYPHGHNTTNPDFPSDIPGKTLGQLFNDLITLIREKVKSAEFKKKLRDREISCTRSYESNKEYINALFNHYRKLLVIRVDLSYLTAYASGVSMEQAHADLSQFLNNCRSNKLLGEKVGYITKLEQGIDGGHHFHCFFFFDGSKHQKDAYFAKMIGDYWISTITKGRGSYHNCNVNKNKYKRLGIGMVLRGDSEMRNNLLLAAKYLSKKEQYLMEKSSAKRKVSRRGVMPSDTAPGPGRKRKQAHIDPNMLRLKKTFQCLETGQLLPPP